VYRNLIPADSQVLAPGGFILLEIGYGQRERVGELLAKSGMDSIEFVPDLQGIARVALAQQIIPSR
jgi:release factor glutamine methyltransferase